MKRITLEEEPWHALRPVIYPLWIQHNAEIAAPEDREEFAPNWDRYDELADLGRSFWLTARADDEPGRLVGYVHAVADTHLHRKYSLSAFWDLYWLHPDYRMGWNGYNLLAEASRSLKRKGVIKQYVGTKHWKNASAIFRRLGFVETETLFTAK